MTRVHNGLGALLALSLPACSEAPDDGNIAIDETVNAAEAANAEIEVLPPDEAAGPPVEENKALPANGSTADGAAMIPAQYQDRWGMNANDCDPAKADAAKGLIHIDGNVIRFYEARAVLKEQRPAIATSFSGLYAFSGEGQTWERVETLTRTGDRLVRADDTGTYRYTRCK